MALTWCSPRLLLISTLRDWTTTPSLMYPAFPPCWKGQPSRSFPWHITIVSKLFNLVQPDLACFGEKDYQQLALIRKMVADMGYDIDIIGVPTVRAKDGLALSSRNGYLTADERKIAPELSKVMQQIAARLGQGNAMLQS